MSRRRQCWDNAPAESFWATLKRETLPANGCFESRAEAQRQIRDWLLYSYVLRCPVAGVRHLDLNQTPIPYPTSMYPTIVRLRPPNGDSSSVETPAELGAVAYCLISWFGLLSSCQSLPDLLFWSRKSPCQCVSALAKPFNRRVCIDRFFARRLQPSQNELRNQQMEC